MSYTRNFEFRIPPEAANRLGRFAAPAAGTPIPIGAPVTVDTVAGVNDLDLQIVKLATSAQAPVQGLSGIAVYEYKGQDGWAGVDPYLTTYSDQDTVPLGHAVQVVFGRDVKVAFRNTTTSVFLNTRTYTGRKMVGGLGATLTLEVGDLLSPGVGNDTDGYWAETQVAADAWLVVTKVDNTRGEVEAQLAF